jgi:1-acyl-sn-glycerol-3-phosphate acyltransferase
LENIPEDERPLLFVGNHTIYGLFDMPLMIYEVRKRTGYTLRGLAHPLHYMSAFGDLLARYGAVKATPRNCFKLLQAGQSVLLYPGEWNCLTASSCYRRGNQ